MAARCPQRVHSSIWPPSAAVRQRAMASRTLIWAQRIHWRLRSRKAVRAARAVLVAGRRYRWPHAITPGRDGLITAPLTLMQSRQALPKTVDPRLTGRPAAQARSEE